MGAIVAKLWVSLIVNYRDTCTPFFINSCMNYYWHCDILKICLIFANKYYYEFFFQRRKKSTREVLEKIRDQISDIEEFNQSTQVWHKKLIGYLLAYFSVLYLIGALVAYLKFFNKPGWRDFTSQIQLLAPFIVAPFM